MKTTITIPFDYKEKELVVTAEVTLGYDGIGSYEFWGQKCYDKGQLRLEEYKVIEARTDVNKGEISEPFDVQILEDNDNLADILETAALEKAGEMEADRADYECERKRDDRLESRKINEVN